MSKKVAKKFTFFPIFRKISFFYPFFFLFFSIFHTSELKSSDFRQISSPLRLFRASQPEIKSINTQTHYQRSRAEKNYMALVQICTAVFINICRLKNGKYRTAIRSARRRERSLDKLENRELLVLINRKAGSEYEPEMIKHEK